MTGLAWGKVTQIPHSSDLNKNQLCRNLSISMFKPLGETETHSDESAFQ